MEAGDDKARQEDEDHRLTAALPSPLNADRGVAGHVDHGTT
jgi:hypothetical protein